MASNHDRRPTDKDAIALLRRLRAGGGDDDVRFVVHRVDVCDAPPEVLVAGLEPAPGTGLNDPGFSRIWYFYHAKKFTNKQGRLSGHRQRSVTDGGGAYWHSELGAKDVQGSGGGTSCTFSYGFKTDPSAKSIHRLGWCMTEYDIADADKKEAEDATAASNFVLCKVYRSPRAKEKSASASSSSKKSKTTRKRKAGGGDHAKAPPAKLIQQQAEPQQVQPEIAYYPMMPCYQPQPQQVHEVAVQQPAGPGGDFNFNIDDINFYVDDSMLRDDTEPEHDGRFIQLPCGPPVLAAEAATVGDIPVTETAVQQQRGAGCEHKHGDTDLNVEEFFTMEWFLRGEPQLPIVEPLLENGGGEFIQMPWAPVVPAVAEASFKDMLLARLEPETMYGQWSGGGMTTSASIPWSSYAPTSSLYTGCSAWPSSRT